MRSWNEINLSPELTMDGSPTLRLVKTTDQIPPESMHHSGGAYAETQYIYGQLIRDGLAQKKNEPFFHVGVVGFGMGYIEIIAVLECLKASRPLDSLRVTSYESSTELYQYFLDNFINSKDSYLPEVRQIYSLIETHLLKDYSAEMIQEGKKWFLKSITETSHWSFLSSLTLEEKVTPLFDVLAYDLYSTKTNPILWEEPRLKNFFFHNMAPQSLVGTYACNKALRQSLEANDFVFETRPGFKGKRNSSRAHRGYVELIKSE